MSSMALINIGTIISGDLENSFVEGDTILIEDGLFSKIGSRADIDVLAANVVVDVKGATVAPGLIDTHVHIVLGDWTPRQNTLGWIESYMHGGVTSMMSASEVHLPGWPKDPVGVKALAITAQRSYSNFHPGGVKVMAGSVIFQPGLTEADFQELADAGIWLGKVGFGDYKKPTDAEPQVRIAQKLGFKIMCHTGGASIPGSAPITAEDLMVLQPDISAHTNGGTTALPDEGLELLVREAPFYLQICQAGNTRSAIRLVMLAREYGQLHRVLIASDTPSGTGVMPMADIKSVVEMSSLAGISASESWALASGHGADVLELNRGRIAAGKEADLVVIDAPLGCSRQNAVGAIENGDIPGISCVIIDGQIRAMKSRNTPAPTRLAEVVSK